MLPTIKVRAEINRVAIAKETGFSPWTIGRAFDPDWPLPSRPVIKALARYFRVDDETMLTYLSDIKTK